MPISYDEAVAPILEKRKQRLIRILGELRKQYPDMESPEIKAMAEREPDIAGLDDQIRAMQGGTDWQLNS